MYFFTLEVFVVCSIKVKFQNFFRFSIFVNFFNRAQLVFNSCKMSIWEKILLKRKSKSEFSSGSSKPKFLDGAALETWTIQAREEENPCPRCSGKVSNA